ncbi:MAG: NAD-dependent epimerase/dehydratase family protein [Opitutaceae bacterium]
MNNPWHVVLGGGPLGMGVADRLIRQGRPVRVATLSSDPDLPGAECVHLDASDADRVHRICADAAVLYFCASPPGDAPDELVLMVQGVTAGLARAGCRLVYAESLLACGPCDPHFQETGRHHPVGPEGRARAAAVAHIMESHRMGRLGVDVVRSSDFFGPKVTRGYLGERVFGPAIRGGSILLRGDPEARHDFSYVDDFARAMVGIGGEAGAFGRIWHTPPVVPSRTNREMIDRIIELAGSGATRHFLPEWLASLEAGLSRQARRHQESAFLRNQPVVVQATRLKMRFGFTATPTDEAIGATIEWYGKQWPGRKSSA